MHYHGITHWLGVDDGNDPFYLFWSGIGSFILSLSVIGGLIGVWRKHICHVQRCWRFGRHMAVDSTTGVEHVVCRKHHPDIDRAPTADSF